MQDVRTRWVIVALAAVLALISAVTILKGRQTQSPVVITGAAPSAQVGPPASTDSGSAPVVVPKSVESAGAPLSATPAESGAQPTEGPAPSTSVTVDVAGAVKAPTVYVLPSDSRVIDAIKAAGGATADADLDAVNLAEKLSDGEKVYLPRKGETCTSGGVQAGNTIGTGGPAATASASGSNKLIDPSDGQINLNTASVADLQRLPGVGPSMAARIIAFRQQNGGFKSAQDLMNVTGIGQKRMARLAPFVVVR